MRIQLVFLFAWLNALPRVTPGVWDRARNTASLFLISKGYPPSNLCLWRILAEVQSSLILNSFNTRFTFTKSWAPGAYDIEPAWLLPVFLANAAEGAISESSQGFEFFEIHPLLILTAHTSRQREATAFLVQLEEKGTSLSACIQSSLAPFLSLLTEFIVYM